MISQHLECHATARQFTSLSLSSGFNPRPDHMELVVDKVALWHFFSQFFNFPQHYSIYASYPHFNHLPTASLNISPTIPLHPLSSLHQRQPTNCSDFKILYINCSYRKLSTYNNSTMYLQKRPSEQWSPASWNTKPNCTLGLPIHDTVMTILSLKCDMEVIFEKIKWYNAMSNTTVK